MTPAEDLVHRAFGEDPVPEPTEEEPISTDIQRIVPAPSNPMAVVRMFVAERYMAKNILLVRHHRGDFYSYDGLCWPQAEDRTLRAELYRWLEPAVFWKKKELLPYEPTKYKVADLIDALQAVAHLAATTTVPAWLLPGQRGRAEEIVVMSNGLLHVPSRQLMAHTPALFSQHALPFAFDLRSPSPTRWTRFLAELFEEDHQAIETLAEVMGYVLAGGTAQQKLFMMVGPIRSGKGTIGRVLTGLLGAHNTAAPTLASLTTNFGLSPLIGKPLALVSDARLGTRTDGLIAVERLLSISGEDSLTIDRKYRDPWTGRLPTRFLILTNELPRFTDSSGALASRFVLFVLTKSFYGREDPGLTDELLAEAPGIFNWALEGLDRLQARGHFVQPDSAQEALRHLADLSSPVGAFVRERCEVGAGFEIDKDELFGAWKEWCQEEGRSTAGTKNVFTRDLRAGVPGLVVARLRDGADRRHVYRGLRILEQHSENTLTIPDQRRERVDVVRDAGRDVPVQNRTSEDVVRVGQGSAGMYSQNGKPASVAYAFMPTINRRVLAALGREPISVDDLAEATGLMRVSLGPPLRTLKDQGLVDLDVSGDGPRWYATEGGNDGS